VGFAALSLMKLFVESHPPENKLKKDISVRSCWRGEKDREKTGVKMDLHHVKGNSLSLRHKKIRAALKASHVTKGRRR